MGDLISRKWLMEAVEEGWIKFDTQEDYNRIIHLIRDIAPSAQPEQVEPCSVSLIEKREQVEGWYYRKIFCCAKCGMKIRTETWGEKRCFGKSTILKDNSMPRYCPYCGSHNGGGAG